MNKKGPIVVIENKQEDRKLFIEVFSELNYPNQTIYFNNVDTACTYLLRHKIKPFLVFADIVLLNVMNNKIIETTLDNVGTIFNCPYLFFTTFFEQSFVIDPYSIPTQSYFIKPYDYTKFKQIIKTIIEYWLESKTITQLNKKQIKASLDN
ncbi:response regulator [Flavobacterium sp. JLP]|uniref:response regulator n=1 Tax=unclassified Flavobacterium TaxID=196869 RepID=UPI00188AC46D|nr:MULTISPECIES: response regulator [unclassified Flavobacterium]MBF4493360.1 response regulator [Flavobacterium sp. MR2016-29]MBF4507873.1 response regulator [Flavobacterium sp. JLP]